MVTPIAGQTHGLDQCRQDFRGHAALPFREVGSGRGARDLLPHMLRIHALRDGFMHAALRC